MIRYIRKNSKTAKSPIELLVAYVDCLKFVENRSIEGDVYTDAYNYALECLLKDIEKNFMRLVKEHIKEKSKCTKKK